MLHIGTQMGLHRAMNAQDFVKVSMRLNEAQYEERVRTWEACNIVAQSVSAGCGLPIMLQTHEWRLQSSSQHVASLSYHLRLERFRHRVSSTLSAPAITPGAENNLSSSQDRVMIYRLLNSDLQELEAALPIDTPPSMLCYLAATQLHLHSFHLLETSDLPEYNDRTLMLYQSASSLITISLAHQVEHQPFFFTQIFIAAAFILLRISTNGFFRTLIDGNACNRLIEGAISALRRISVVNNDLPARLGDVIAFFCALESPETLGGQTREDLQLREVRHRLGVSVVYDSLRIWRRHFEPEQPPVSYRDDQQGIYGWISTEELAFASSMGNWIDMDFLV